MRHLLAVWQKVEPLMREHSVMLFLDYDGTLTPIVERPALAKLSSEEKELLSDLMALEDVKIAIVSGRSLADLKERVGVKGLLYAGNHGLEFEGPSIRFVHPEALAAKHLMQKAARGLQEAFKEVPGILVEHKVFTISVHYRKLPEEKVPEAKAVFSKILLPYVKSSKVILKEGKKVWEIRPSTRWHKGTLVLWLLARVLARSSKKVLPIYVGDDQTDEDAFKAVRQRGLGVKVIENKDEPTRARYCLDSPKEVFDFLKRLAAVKRDIKEKSCA